MDNVTRALVVSTVVCVGVGFWIVADMRFALRAMRNLSILGEQGLLEEVCVAHELLLKTRRPFVRLLQRAILPGALEASYALQLYLVGRMDPALTMADRAVGSARNRPAILAGALAARIQILTSLGRYEEAREEVARLRAIPALHVQPSLLPVVGLLAFYLGDLAEARAVADEALAKEPRDSSSKGLLATIHMVQGETRRAIDALLDAPSDASLFLPPGQRARMESTSEGAELVETLSREYKHVMHPARHLLAADAYLEAEDIAGAEFCLNRAADVLGNNPAIQAGYDRLRARTCAARGEADEAERYLGAARDHLRRIPKRDVEWETLMAEGRARLALGQPHKAARALGDAARVALHPIEHHTTRYWRARAFEALGQAAESLVQYDQVIRDGFATWMRSRALEAVGRLRNPPPPLVSSPG